MEVSGQAGSGKTCFCLELLHSALQLDPTHYCIYISTETSFPIDRFNQLIDFQSNQEQIRNRILLQSFDHLDAFENYILQTLKEMGLWGAEDIQFSYFENIKILKNI